MCGVVWDSLGVQGSLGCAGCVRVCAGRVRDV